MSNIDRQVLKTMFEPGSGYSWLTLAWKDLDIAESMILRGASLKTMPNRGGEHCGGWWEWQSYNFYRQAVETEATRHPKL